MELRVLEYFLALTQEGSISTAADVLHISQPTLSRQLMGLEEELGTTLFDRGRHGITLTEDGMLLRRRAAEIFDLVRITESEIMLNRGVIAGEIRIGCAETQAMDVLAKMMHELQIEHPDVTFRISSGLAEQVVEQINHGLVDFGLLLRVRARWGLDNLCLHTHEHAAVIMRQDDELAQRKTLTFDELAPYPVLIPSSYQESNLLGGELPIAEGGRLKIVAQFDLPFSASRMVLAGMGYAIVLEGALEERMAAGLVTRRLEIPLDMPSYLVWKPFQLRTRACEAFLEHAQSAFAPDTHEESYQVG